METQQSLVTHCPGGNRSEAGLGESAWGVGSQWAGILNHYQIVIGINPEENLLMVESYRTNQVFEQC